MGLATGFVYCILLGKMFYAHTFFLAGVCFGIIFKPPLNGYGVCAAMCLRCLAASMSVASCLSGVCCNQDTVFGSYFDKRKSLKANSSMPNNFRFYVEVTRVSPVFTCCREMQVLLPQLILLMITLSIFLVLILFY